MGIGHGNATSFFKILVTLPQIILYVVVVKGKGGGGGFAGPSPILLNPDEKTSSVKTVKFQSWCIYIKNKINKKKEVHYF